MEPTGQKPLHRDKLLGWEYNNKYVSAVKLSPINACWISSNFQNLLLRGLWNSPDGRGSIPRVCARQKSQLVHGKRMEQWTGGLQHTVWYMGEAWNEGKETQSPCRPGRFPAPLSGVHLRWQVARRKNERPVHLGFKNNDVEWKVNLIFNWISFWNLKMLVLQS